jgi:hypothetical protein
MSIAKIRIRFAGLVLSLLLMAVEAGAIAHELEHQLTNPDQPCAQCLFVGHQGKVPATVATFPVLVTPESFLPTPPTPALAGHRVAVYAARAPPASSEN